MSLIIPLVEVADHEAERVGPKAASLSRMLRAGFPVPPGFCITGAAYREHIRHSALAGRVEEAVGEAERTPDRKAALLAGLRDAIAGAPMAVELTGQIEHHWKAMSAPAVAVRSSATAEDLPHLSFAGQYDTYLDLTNLSTCLQRVQDCWGSLWSDRAFDYRCGKDVTHLGVEMAVIVQVMVPADTAGVMFTADPISGRRDCAVIEASFGPGDAVASGKVTPDRIVVSKRVFGVEHRVSSGRAAKPCLDDATAARLALLGADIESLLGGPQDVEWVVVHGHLRVLQARPITSLPPEPRRSWEDRQIWTNANTGEVVPDVMTPMTYTFISDLASQMFEPLIRRAGIQLDPADLFGLIAGRMYFNVNTLVAIGESLPVRMRKNPGILFGGGWPGAKAPTEVRIPPEDLPGLRLGWYHKLTRLPETLLWFLRNPMRRWGGILTSFDAYVTKMAHQPWRALGDEALARRILSADRLLRDEVLADGTTILTQGVGMACGLLLMDLCRWWLGDQSGDVAKRLLTGLGGMEDAEAGIALWKLAATAHTDANVAGAIREEEHFAGVSRRIAGSHAGDAFLAAWSDFMETHGHHARGELELSNPRWAQQPDYILGLVRSYLGGVGRADPVARAQRLAQERRRLARQCLRRLRNPVKRLIFDAVLRRGQEGMRLRETQKGRVVRWVAMLREMLLEMGRRLARREILGDTEDVFFLEIAELVPAAAGNLDPGAAIAKRRAEYERNVALDPPGVVFGRFDPQRTAPQVLDEKAGVLHGIGVSPGTARGEARVILHAGQGHVMPGEVLVAPFTDPAWTPYFLNAAAIVMDQGGQLSHGCIVAREYGIPCVVNVGPATKLIQTGRLLEVDGSRGVVRLLEP